VRDFLSIFGHTTDLFTDFHSFGDITNVKLKTIVVEAEIYNFMNMNNNK